MRIFRQARSIVREWTKTKTRSPEWARVRRDFLKEHAACSACGDRTLLQVHHKRPFHLHPELELDPTNLIALCMGKNECHLDIGHGGDWKSYNPSVEEDARTFASGSQEFAEAKAHLGRLKD